MGFFRAKLWLADDSGDVILDSDWLPRRVESVQCIKIWRRDPKAESMY